MFNKHDQKYNFVLKNPFDIEIIEVHESTLQHKMILWGCLRLSLAFLFCIIQLYINKISRLGCSILIF